MRAGKAADEPFEADDPDLEAARLATHPLAVEHADAARLEHLDEFVAAIDMPVVVAQHRVDRHLEPRASLGQGGGLLGPAEVGEVAGQQHQVDGAVQRGERARNLVAIPLAAVHVAGRRDPHPPSAGVLGRLVHLRRSYPSGRRPLPPAPRRVQHDR